MTEYVTDAMAQTRYSLILIGLLAAPQWHWQQWIVRSHIVHGFAAFAGDWHSSGAGRATTRHSEIDNESRSNAGLDRHRIRTCRCGLFNSFDVWILYGVSANDPVTFATVAIHWELSQCCLLCARQACDQSRPNDSHCDTNRIPKTPDLPSRCSRLQRDEESPP